MAIVVPIMGATSPREIEGHLIDPEPNIQVGRGAEIEEQLVLN